MEISSGRRELYLQRLPAPGSSKGLGVEFSMSIEWQVHQAIDDFVHEYDAISTASLLKGREFNVLEHGCY